MNQYQKVPLLNETKEIILGSLLGDGSLKIHKNYQNARFSFKHSILQKKYFLWKVSKLIEVSSEKNTWIQNNQGFSKRTMLRYQSKAIESLTELYNFTHKRAKFKISRRWLNYLSPLSLAIWWLDDGSIISNGRKGVFCTDGFDKKSVQILARYLQITWQIETKIAPVYLNYKDEKREYWRLWLGSTSQLQKFLQIILPSIEVEEMLPKVILLYHDNQLQQRWISEIVKKTHFSKETVNKYMILKKKKWKKFQKKI